jgi:RNA polymerase sigma factor (TIGR02999 family)
MGRQDVTSLLKKAQSGSREALDLLMPLVYQELRQIAQSQMQSERMNHTLQPTALVHEAYIRLIDQKEVDWQNRAHFFYIAAVMMRRILINHANKRNAQKRGEGQTLINLDDADSNAKSYNPVDVLEIDQLLKELENLDQQQAKIVELRFFAGLTVAEIASVLEVSESTVKREWRSAKAWLKSKLLS